MSNPSHVTLAVESAICGCSISLIRAGSEIANWVGSANVSKAEDLLLNIDAMLTSTNIAASDIDLIAVSAGPGSFTGIRIGIATALGLKAGLGIEMSSESALKAMAFTQPDVGCIVAALPVGRNAVCLQSFRMSGGEVAALDEPRTITESGFLTFVQKDELDFLLHEGLYEKVSPSPSITNFGTNVALAIGRICRENRCVLTKPLFISKSF